MVQQSRMPKPPSPTLSAIILPEDAAPKIKALLAYWQSIHPAGGGLPGRRHLDPIDIPELLPNIWMIDVKRGPLRFRFRLVGTEIVKFTGRDATGCWLDEIYPGYAERDAFAFHSPVPRGGKPGYRKGGGLPHPRRHTLQAAPPY